MGWKGARERVGGWEPARARGRRMQGKGRRMRKGRERMSVE